MEYRYIRSAAELTPYLASLKAAEFMAVDTETTGLDPHLHQLRLVQIAVAGLPVLLLDCFSMLPRERELLRDVLSVRAVKIFQNAKFDLQFLLAQDIYPAEPLFDTMLAAQLLRSGGGPRRVHLAALAEHYLDIELVKDEQKSNWTGELTASQLEYAAGDAAVLLRLCDALNNRLLEHNLLTIAQIEFQCVLALAQMEYHGLYLHLPAWRELCRRTEREREAALEKLQAFDSQATAQMTLWGDQAISNANYDSNPYVLDLLRRNGLAVKATGKNELAPHRRQPLVRALTEYRRAGKALSSILYPFQDMVNPQTGRLHPHYGQIGAWSGRMSCGNPNIQQIPRDAAFRACFTAPPGRCLIIADYSQIELRVAAQISGDKRMITAYQGEEDLHLLTASLLVGKPIGEITRQERQAAKAVNFGLIFGMGAAGLQQYALLSYGVELSPQQAAEFRRRFFLAYPGIAAWHQGIKEHPSREGRTLTGRKFLFSENAGVTGQYNTPVQGTAADIAKKALGLLGRRLIGSQTHIVGFIHDEILLEAPQEEAKAAAVLLRGTMEEAAQGILTLVPAVAEVKIAANWAEK